MQKKIRGGQRLDATVRLALVSVSYLALIVASDTATQAQTPPAQQSTPQQEVTPLPPVQVRAPRPRRPAQRGRQTGGTTEAPAAPPQPDQQQNANSQDGRTGTIGIYSNSTSVATKSNTPLVNIPQSLNVLSKTFIQDQSFQSVTDATRYVPGVAVHQGEGNRDELVIRGVDSSANFYVNGFRDDVQVFRDLYNTQSLEVLKGPSALTFGRASGGGLVNRTLKEADWTTVREAMFQTGSFFDRRFSIDVGQGFGEGLAGRVNAFYEKSDTFRKYGELERWGFNPTFTIKPNDTTKIKLSYEVYNDQRTADRGNPSQANSLVAPGSTRFNPAFPFAPNGDLSAFFGSPTLNIARASVQSGMAFIEHDFENGLTVTNGTRVALYKKFYQNVYPGGGPFAGAVNVADTSFNYAAYNHETDRNNIFNQTDFVYKVHTGPAFHTIAFGTEFGRQAGIDYRETGIFSNGMNTITGNPFNPTFFGPVTFIHHSVGGNPDGVANPDSNSRYRALISSAYARDTIELTKWLQLIGGVRFDRFDLSATDMNPAIPVVRSRVDNVVSPAGAVIVKPMETLSIYTLYSVSYLPASGDQFSSLTNATVILTPQKFENTEVGVKWNIQPRLLFSAAAYDLKRTGVPIPDANNPGFSLPNGSHRIRGFETNLVGYVTPEWQSSFGYAYTDARIASTLSATVVAGNRVQLVPLNQFSWWNKYQFNPMWSAAVGLIYFSDSFANSDDAVVLPGFFRVDAGVYARINETWRAQLNIENVFNKGYWASADGNNNLSPGAPRTVRLTAFAKF